MFSKAVTHTTNAAAPQAAAERCQGPRGAKARRIHPAYLEDLLVQLQNCIDAVREQKVVRRSRGGGLRIYPGVRGFYRLSVFEPICLRELGAKGDDAEDDRRGCWSTPRAAREGSSTPVRLVAERGWGQADGEDRFAHEVGNDVFAAQLVCFIIDWERGHKKPSEIEAKPPTDEG